MSLPLASLADSMRAVSFQNEWLLWLIPLAIVGVAAVNLFAWWRTRLRLRRFLGQGVRRLNGLERLSRFRFLRAAMLALGLSLLIFAAARPVTPRYAPNDEADRYGLDFFVAIDASKSMLAVDVPGAEIAVNRPSVPTPRGFAPPPRPRLTRQANRLDLARAGVRRVFESSQGDRIGLIAFSQNGYLRAPFTYDFTALDLVLRSITPGNTLPGGSSMVAGMERAQKVFEKLETPRKVLVIISDGEELAGDAVATARRLRENGIRVFTIGVGSIAGGQIPAYDPQGNPVGYLTDAAGNTVVTRLDELTLRQVAEAGGGVYQPMGADAEGFFALYEQHLRPLGERVRDTLPRNFNEHFQWPLAFGFFMLLLEFLLRERRLPLEGGAVLANT
ncbi:MAG: VWA domain-containing protein [Opitutales bacterium]